MGKVDTMRYYVYIHGSPDSVETGKRGSIGRIRIHNQDLLELYGRSKCGTEGQYKDS